MEKRKGRKKAGIKKRKYRNKSKNKNKNKGKNGNNVGLSFLYSAIFCILLLVSVIYETKLNENNYIQNYSKQQQLLVNEVASRAEEYMITNEKNNSNLVESKVVDNIIKKAETSGNRYWIFAKDDKIIFKKNDELSSSIEGESFEEIKNENQIISIQNFKINNNEYLIGRSTDKSYALSVGKVNEHNIYSYLIAGIFCSVFSISNVMYSLKIKEKKDEIEKQEEQIKKKNILIDTLSSKIEYQEDFEKSKNVVFDSLNKKDNDKFLKNIVKKIDSKGINSVAYDQYKFKFYLNASHSIYIEGILGERHPHTWELSLDIMQVLDGFVQFNNIEKEFEKVLSKYQDQYINMIEPFNTINPTLENICEYFKDRLKKLSTDMGLILMKIEISETPARSYIIDLIDEVDLSESENKNKENVNCDSENTVDKATSNVSSYGSIK